MCSVLVYAGSGIRTDRDITMSKVLLVDSQPIVRDAVRAVVEGCGHQVVGEADNGQEALLQCRDLAPDIVILELAIPRLGGLDVLRRLRASTPSLRLVVFSAQDSSLYASRSLHVGADAFVSKSDPASELERALAAVARGRSYFPQHAVHPLGGGLADAGEGGLAHLSAREMTVLQMLCQGLSNKDISDQLSLSYKTVSTYKVRLHQKLNVGSDFQLLQVARSHGLVAADSEQVPEDSNPYLEHQLGLLHALIDAAPNPMFVRDPEGRLLLCNRLFMERTGLSQETLRGSRLEDASWLPPALRQRSGELFREAVRREEPFISEAPSGLAGKPGSVHVWCVPYRNQEGELIAMVGGMQYLAERDRQLAELRHQRFQALHRSRLKSETLAAVGEELGDRLLALRDMLAGAPGSDATQLRQRIVSGGRQVDALLASIRQIDELLDVERNEAEPPLEPHALETLTRETLDELLPQLESAGFELDLGPGLLSLKRAWVDAGHYRQLLVSLVECALLTQAPGRLCLHLSNALHLRGMLRLSIDVSPWRPVSTGGTASGLTQARLQRLLTTLGALSQVLPEEGGRLRIELDLPLAL